MIEKSRLEKAIVHFNSEKRFARYNPRVKNYFLMNDVLKMGKKAFTVFVAAATLLWTVGVVSFVAPLAARATSYDAGDLIKGETLSTVYYYGTDGLRYSFPNEKTYFTWYADFDDVVTISDEDLADISLGGNIVYRPGSRWIKVDNLVEVYAVSTDGTIHWIEDADVAEDLAGANWNQFIDDVPDAFFTDYVAGDSIVDASEGYEGMLVDDAGTTYLIWGGEKREVSDMDANRFDSDFVLDGDGVDLDSMTTGDEIDSELDNMTDTAQVVEEETYTETTEVTVSVAADSPDSMTLASGTDTTIDVNGFANLVSYEFENPTDEDLTITSFALTRGGVSSDTTLANVYLFDGYVRLTDSATLSSGKVTWNDSSGLFTIPANSSATIDIWGDIAYATSGQTVYLKIASVSDITFDGTYEATGDFPLQGATHSIATVSNLSYFDVNATTTPTLSGIDAQLDYRIWENTVNIGNNEMYLYSIRFRNIGSIDDEDIENFRLYIAGVNYGDAVVNQDANGYITFDLSDDPVRMNTGNHIVKVLADIIGGSTRTVTLSLRTAADVVAMDEDYDQATVTTDGGGTAYANHDAGAQTINQGTLVISKTTTSPSGNVTNGATNMSLAKFDVKAYGEDMKVENLNFYVDESDNDTAFTLRNGAVYADGVQIGSTAALASNSDATLAYTAYAFGSSLVIEPGETVVIEVKGDIYDSDGTNDCANADTLQVNMDNTTSSNVLRRTSGSYTTYPAADVAANTLTVAQGSLTVAKNTSYANQSLVAPKTAYKMGSFTIASSTTEIVNITQFDVDWTTADAADASEDLTNLYIEYGPTASLTTSSIKGTVTDSDNTWSVNYALAASSTIYVNVYSSVPTSSTNGDATADTFRPSLTITAQGAGSAADASASAVTGQTITSTTGSFAQAEDSMPAAKVAAANQEVETAKFRFTSTNETYTIKEVTVSVASATVAGVIGTAKLYDGSTLLGSAAFDQSSNTRALIYVTGGLEVPYNTYKTLTVKHSLNDVGTGAATSQQDVATTLYSVKYADSTGVETTATPSGLAGNAVYVYKSIPTATIVDLTNGDLSNGNAQEIYKFTVAAASNSSIALKQIKLNITWSDGGTADTLEVESLKFYKNGTDISSSVTIVDEDGNSVTSTSGLLEGDDTCVITFTSTEDTISAGSSVTYAVKGTPTGFRVLGATDTARDSVALYLKGDAAHNGTSIYLNDETDIASGQSEIIELFTSAAASSSDGTAANFIWSDMSSISHTYDINASSSGDWANGYLVLNLDLDSESWGR